MTIGLAGPFARPSRTMVTLAAILFGVIAVTFGAGLGASLNRVYNDLNLTAEQVQVNIPGGPASGSVVKGPGPGPAVPSPAGQERAVEAALRAQPGTLHYVAEADDDISVLGLPDRLSLTGFARRRELDRLRHDHRALVRRDRPGGRQHRLPHRHRRQGGKHLHADLRHQAPQGPDRRGGLRPPRRPSRDHRQHVHPGRPRSRPGPRPVRRGAEAGHQRPGLRERAERRARAPLYNVSVNGGNSTQFYAIIGLIATLTLLLVAVAGLGVLNTVVLQTRERVHDLGVFKAVGMTPRQTIAMVVCSVAGIGLAAGLAAIPAGVALHHDVLPVMAHAAQTDVPHGRSRCITLWSSSCSHCPGWSSPWRARCSQLPGLPAPGRRRPCGRNDRHDKDRLTGS